MISNFFDKVQDTVKKYNMTNKSEHLLVALSGGADSVALLLCLYELGYNISACHINHQLRGEESDRDEQFCVKLCESLGVKLDVRRIDVNSYCKVNSLSTEEGARILRYKAFSEIECDKICTAHNLNDCLETTVFNLARGSGLKGICSIPPCRDNIIRPLIECTRVEIEAFLSEKEQSFVTDSTNLEDEYSRNKIRHRVIPQLKKINPSLFKTYAKTLSYIREDNAFLEKLADENFDKSKVDDGYNSHYINELDFPIRRRVIVRILDNENITVSADRISDLEKLCEKSGKVNVKQNTFAVSSNNFLRIVTENKSDETAFTPLVIDSMGEYEYQGRKIEFKFAENISNLANVHKMFANCCLDYDKIKGTIIARRRIEGDTIQLCNRDFTSDVRKLLKKSFPAEKRNSVVLLADSEGLVFVENYGVAHRVRIDENTKHILTFKIS